MKKTKLWKRIAGWLLVFLLVLQLPVNVFAEEWVDNTPYSSEENFIDEQDISEESDSSDDQTDVEEASDSEDQIDFTEEIPMEDSVDVEEETDTDADSDMEESDVSEFTSEDEFTDGSTALFSDGTVQSEDKTDEKKEIQVIVSISKDGKFLDDKDGNPMAGRTVTLTGQSSYTMDDALRLAHDLYYPGGADAGYDYHSDDAGIFDGVIYRLWGYDKKNVPYIKSSLNRDSANYGSALGRTVQDGDEMHFFIQQKKGQDKLAFFTEEELTVTEGKTVKLKLRQEDDGGRAYSNCEGASIYIDGKKQENLVTDENGEVTLPYLESRTSPYFVTAEKLTESTNGSVTAISAAYANITVVPANSQSGEYISKIKLQLEKSGKKSENEILSDNAEQGMTFPVELNHGDFFVSVETTDDFPTDASVYAVYTNPLDGIVYRKKVSQDTQNYLKNTSDSKSYNAITSIKFEVCQSGNILQEIQVPIYYKDHLSSLTLYDSWGKEISTDLADSLEDQEINVEVPENSQFIDLNGSSDTWGSIAENLELISIENAEFENVSGHVRFIPDWKKYDKYTAVITLKKDEKRCISEDTVYTIHIRPGETDYTPILTDNREPNGVGIMQGEKAEPFIVQASVLQENEGKLSYQWYVSSSASSDIKDYDKIENAVENSYTINTTQPQYYRYYRCLVSYEINTHLYTATSNVFSARVYPHVADKPVILQQPKDTTYVKGIPITEKLEIVVQKSNEFGVKTEYQWYQNRVNSTQDGILISGATENTYSPEIKETGITYYYCKVKTNILAYINGDGVKISSEEICSDIACVTVTEAPLPWEGNGSESSPYLLKTASDVEALRDKVNTEGFSFENTYFQLTEDITLPTGWKPIGVTKDGRKDLKNGENLNAFSGIFDGNNHTVIIPEGGLPLFGYVRNTRIRNLNIYGKKIAGYGLVNNFEGVGLSGMAVEIDNVTLKSGSSTLKSGLLGANKTMSPYAGCSSAFEATVRNCTIEKDVVIGYDRNENEIGAIAGRMQGTVEDCVSYAIVYGTSYVGGIIGTRDNAMGNCSVIGCKFYGTVEASGEVAGGIVGGGYDNSTAPNGCKITINSCSSEGSITGSDKVGGILGGDLYVAQTWNNCTYTFKNNSFTGKVQATKADAAYVGGIIGFYDSLNRIDDITNNYYAKDCGADKGIGFVRYIDTNCLTHETASGATYVNTEKETTSCPKVEGCGWQTGYNRTDDPLGADQEKLVSTEGLRVYVDSLELTGDYRTEFCLGEDLDLSGMKVVAVISDGTRQELSLTDLTIEGYNKDKRGEQKLKISYKEAFVELTVKVLKKDAGTITVSFTLLGDSVHGSAKEDQEHTLRKGNLDTWIAAKDYTIDGNANVLELLKEVLSKNGMSCRTLRDETYIAGITKDGQELAEFSNGQNSGWMYTLNGIHPDLGVKEQYLEDGDEIVFHYTDDYTLEHDHVWDSKWNFDKDAHWHECVAMYGKCDITDNTKKGGYQKHSYGKGKQIKAATYKTTGLMRYTCQVCGYEKTETIPVIAHTHKYTWKTTAKATVFRPAKQEGTCSLCGKKQTRNYGSKLKATIKLNVSSLTLRRKQATTKVKVSMAYGDSIKSWASSNKKIVTVYKNGKIKAGTKTGTAKITVTLKSGKKATLKVKVQTAKVKTTKISGLKKKLTIKKGKSVTLKPVVSPITSQEKVTYRSSNKKIATVSSKGVVKGRRKGTVTITVKSGKVTKKIKITVK
ncbi:Ig-like domain-containing protein [Blautia obeum]|uniref:Ig-like domain-containing protein n=1 Tax=Blautia obeum TaxID=40520 RepID=UPI003219FD9F